MRYLPLTLLLLFITACGQMPANNGANKSTPASLPGTSAPHTQNPPFGSTAPTTEPPVTKKTELADVIVWEEDDFQFGLQYDGFAHKYPAIKAKTGVDPTGKKGLLEANTENFSFYDVSRAITASELAKITAAHLTANSGLVFTKFTPAIWTDPIPGEVRFINGLRFQYITTDSSDNYSMLVVSKNLQNAAFNKTLKIKVPDPSIFIVGKVLGEGGKGTVKELSYKSRKLAMKKMRENKFGNYVKEEIQSYEKIYEKIPQSNLIYRGFLGDTGYNFGFGGDGKNIVMLLELGENMQGFLTRSSKKDIEESFKPMLSFMAEFHKQGFLHNDIKVDNFIVAANTPQIIDLDNMSQYGQIQRGDGFTSPYYTIGENFGIPSDLKALGFTLFAMRYYNDNRPDYINKFTPPDADGLKYLDADLLPKDIIDLLLPGADKIDRVIIKLLESKYANASDAQKEL